MPKIKVKDQTAQTGERPQTNGRIRAPAMRSIITPASTAHSVRRIALGLQTGSGTGIYRIDVDVASGDL